MGAFCVLPARLSSTRIPDKPLQPIAGHPLIEWTWRAALRVPGVTRVLIATDSARIVECAAGFGAEVLLTRGDHASGTDRVNEAAEMLEVAEADLVINFQADEPFVDVQAVGRALDLLASESRVSHRSAAGRARVATLAAPIAGHEEWASDAVVKLARAADGRALYFSRAPIPYPRDSAGALPANRDIGSQGVDKPPGAFLRHVGVYVYRRSTLRAWAALPASALERIERLEQLRALEAGMRIEVVVGTWTEPGVDTPEDLVRAARILEVCQ